jgi:hypothetical protein
MAQSQSDGSPKEQIMDMKAAEKGGIYKLFDLMKMDLGTQ